MKTTNQKTSLVSKNSRTHFTEYIETCQWCGKKFSRFTPEWGWTIRIANETPKAWTEHIEYYCSYACLRKAEKAHFDAGKAKREKEEELTRKVWQAEAHIAAMAAASERRRIEEAQKKARSK